MTSNSSVNLLTEVETSELLKISVSTLQRWRSEGRGPRFIKLSGGLGSHGGPVRYKEDDIRDWTNGLPVGGGEG